MRMFIVCATTALLCSLTSGCLTLFIADKVIDAAAEQKTKSGSSASKGSNGK